MAVAGIHLRNGRGIVFEILTLSLRSRKKVVGDMDSSPAAWARLIDRRSRAMKVVAMPLTFVSGCRGTLERYRDNFWLHVIPTFSDTLDNVVRGHLGGPPIRVAGWQPPDRDFR